MEGVRYKIKKIVAGEYTRVKVHKSKILVERWHNKYEISNLLL